MYNGCQGQTEPLHALVQALRLEVHAPEEICKAEAELVRLMRKHQYQVGNFALIAELCEAAERLQRLLHQHENGTATWGLSRSRYIV
jgi:hypothetical protein